MALLQISEPGQGPDPHQRKVAIGIDLGTTHSLVAAVRHGAAECLPDEHGRVLLPSAITYTRHPQLGVSRRLGHEAFEAHAPEMTQVTSIKRLMGRSLADVKDAGSFGFDIIDQGGLAFAQTVAGPKSPVEVSAEILATLRQRAEDTFDDEVFGAVITVPAYFDDGQRQATKDAADMAGLEVLRLINEPTAAAIAYGLDNASEGLYLVFDLGGGTFDVSLLRMTAGVFEVLATGGDTALGGDDFDRVLAHHVWAMQGQGGAFEDAPLATKTAYLRAARRCKEALTDADAVDFSLPDVPSVTLSRATFNDLAQPLVKQAMQSVKRVLRDAQMSTDDILGVVMVGGSTRMPVVRDAVAQHFGKPPLTNLNPDEVVALGAALQAQQLTGQSVGTDVLLLDVIPLSLGLETMGGLVERIVPRNTTIPTAMAQDFTTYKDGQTALALHVVQGERDLVQDCRSLARFELRGIPPMSAGAARIRVTFTIDADGLLAVSAQETTTGISADITVKPSYGLSDEQIAHMLQDGFATAQADMKARAVVEARVDLQRLIDATRSALAADGGLISTEQRTSIEAVLVSANAAVPLDDAAAIEAAQKQLAQATEAFAAIRMNHSIAQALAGQSIHQL